MYPDDDDDDDKTGCCRYREEGERGAFFNDMNVCVSRMLVYIAWTVDLYGAQWWSHVRMCRVV